MVGSPPPIGPYAFYNGTSMAAPHVSGVAALWLAVDPSLTPAQLLTELQGAALPRTAAQCPQPCGAGLLNAVGGPIITPAPPLVVTISLADGKIKNNETTTATATVTLSGNPEPNTTVTFSTDEAGIAVIDGPSTAVTDANGKATATVRGVAKGSTDVTASTSGGSDSEPIRVPTHSTIVITLLALAMLIVASRRIQRPLNRE